MTTRMPAVAQSRTASIASSRGGSMKPVRPSSVAPCSTSREVQVLAFGRHRPRRECEHALATLRQPGDGRVPVLAVERHVAPRDALRRAHRQYALRRALDQHERAVVVAVVQRGHETMGRIERNLVLARQLATHAVDVVPRLDGQ